MLFYVYGIVAGKYLVCQVCLDFTGQIDSSRVSRGHVLADR